METVVPVYFAVEDEALLSIYEQTQAASAAQGSASAAEGRPGLQERAGCGHARPLPGPPLPASTWRSTQPCGSAGPTPAHHAPVSGLQPRLCGFRPPVPHRC